MSYIWLYIFSIGPQKCVDEFRGVQRKIALRLTYEALLYYVGDPDAYNVN